MQWRGDKLQSHITQKGLTQERFADLIGVTRQTLSAWIKGQVPKGVHLIHIWEKLEVEAKEFFDPPSSPLKSFVMHRTYGASKKSDALTKAANELAGSYSGLFDDTDAPVLQVFAPQRTDEAAEKLAFELRKLMGLENSSDPPKLQHVFKLFSELKICVILHAFPEEIKDYAFYIQLHGMRVVFVNTEKARMDMTFALLHEIVHAIRSCGHTEDVTDEQEDKFCDKVAGLVQIPDAYLRNIKIALQKKEKREFMKTLKEFAKLHEHAVLGLAKRMGYKDNLKPYILADATLRKESPKLVTLLESDEPSVYLKKLEDLSPLWFAVIKRHYASVSMSRLAQYLDISHLDARRVVDVLNAL